MAVRRRARCGTSRSFPRTAYPGSASYDLHDKLRAYRRNGVPEYVVWRTIDRAIDWFRLKDGEYVRIQPDENSIIESAVFPGLRLNVPAMLARERAAVLAALG